jgi:hypothetical protein
LTAGVRTASINVRERREIERDEHQVEASDFSWFLRTAVIQSSLGLPALLRPVWTAPEEAQGERQKERKVTMNIDGPKIYPDPAKPGISFEPREWRRSEGHFISHLPTGCMFEIGCDEDAMMANRATLFSFYGRLVHVCDGRRIPQGEELEFLSRGAVGVYLMEIGAWKPDIVEVAEPSPYRGLVG